MTSAGARSCNSILKEISEHLGFHCAIMSRTINGWSVYENV
jgi:hypothetical protein